MGDLPIVSAQRITDECMVHEQLKDHLGAPSPAGNPRALFWG